MGGWASNISWLGDSDARVSASLEIDIYGGYKASLGDFAYDLGVLRYQYPGSYPSGYVSPNTTELYGQVSWKMLSLKYSHSVGDTFGVAQAKNSYYLEANASVPLSEQISFNLHLGRQAYRGAQNGVSNALFLYSDYKVEAVYAIDKAWGVGAGYSDTNAQRAAYTNPHGRFLAGSMGYIFAKKQF